MNVTERKVSELQSKESVGNVRYGHWVSAVMLPSAVAAFRPVSAELPRISVRRTSGSYPATIVRNKSFESRIETAIARVELVRKLRQLRANAIAGGMSLLSADDISVEVRNRRGELD